MIPVMLKVEARMERVIQLKNVQPNPGSMPAAVRKDLECVVLVSDTFNILSMYLLTYISSSYVWMWFHDDRKLHLF